MPEPIDLTARRSFAERFTADVDDLVGDGPIDPDYQDYPAATGARPEARSSKAGDIEVDYEAGAAFVYLRDVGPDVIARTRVVSDDVLVDYDADGQAVGVELLDLAPFQAPAAGPGRDDEVAAWLRQWREQYSPGLPEYVALDAVLDDYRLHADTGTPLGEHACGGPNCCAGEATIAPAASPGRDETTPGELPATMTEPVQYQGDADDAGMPSAWDLLGIMPDAQPPRPDPARRPGGDDEGRIPPLNEAHPALAGEPDPTAEAVATPGELMDLLESAWCVIANAGLGATHDGTVGWHNETEDWQRAAERLRDRWHEVLRAWCSNRSEPHLRPRPTPMPDPDLVPVDRQLLVDVLSAVYASAGLIALPPRREALLVVARRLEAAMLEVGRAE